MESLIPTILFYRCGNNFTFTSKVTSKVTPIRKQDEITEWRLFRAKEGTVSL